MRIYVDVFDASGNRIGPGPVTKLLSASVNRALDGAGSFSFRSQASDTRALSLFQNERRIELWGEDVGGKRLMAEGIIRNIAITESPSGAALRVSGPDILDELKRRNTLLARIYEQVTLSTLANDLIGLVPGWSVDIDVGLGSQIVEARYDGTTVLAAFQHIAKKYGYHIRKSDTTPKTLEIGIFGDDSGLRINKTEIVTQQMIANQKLLLAKQIQTTDDSSDVYNWILPIGAGEGVAALTLEKSTRSSPYTIQNMVGPDGTTLYYISDAASIAVIGQIEKVAQFKDIAPLTNSDDGVEDAGNALYDAAVEWLLRHKDAKETYTTTVVNAKQSIRAGDKIRVDYLAQVREDNQLIDYLNVRGDYWVISARENIGLEGSSVDLEISNIDRRTTSNARLVMDTVNSMELRNLKPQSTSSARSYVYDREIAAGFDANLPIEFTNATVSLQRVRLRLKTTPFRATASTAASGGGATTGGTGHVHRIASDLGPAGSYTNRKGEFSKADGLSTHFFNIESNDVPFADIYTYGDSPAHTHSTPAHTHSLSFAISDDSQTPINVTVFVNGINRTVELFGASTLAPSGGNLDVVADTVSLTDYILNASGGLRQVHDIDIKCASGQGRAEVTVEIFEVTQAIKL